MTGLLLRLYPARWRARYGPEFAAVLDERPLGPFDVADVVLGAIDAHLHLRGLGVRPEHRKGFAMSLRIGGYAAIAGGALWFLLLIGNAINSGGDSFGPLLGFAAIGATATTLIALIGLSAFQARRHPVLTWLAFLIPAGGAIVVLAGWTAMAVLGDSDAEIVAGLSAWVISMIGLMTLLVGSAVFAIATWRTRSLSRAGSTLLGIGAVMIVPALAGVSGNLGPEALGLALLAISILAFPAGWIALGVSAIRIDGSGVGAPAGVA